MITVFEIFNAVQYDGTNGEAIETDLGMSATFDNGTTLVIAGVEIPSTRWLVWTFAPVSGDVVVHEVITDEQFAAQYAAQVEPFAAPELITATGSTAVPASTLGGVQNITVNLSTPLPDTTYTPIASLRGAPNVLGGHGITAVTVVDEDTVTVQVTSAALSLAGATAHVAVIALAAS